MKTVRGGSAAPVGTPSSPLPYMTVDQVTKTYPRGFTTPLWAKMFTGMIGLQVSKGTVVSSWLLEDSPNRRKRLEGFREVSTTPRFARELESVLVAIEESRQEESQAYVLKRTVRLFFLMRCVAPSEANKGFLKRLRMLFEELRGGTRKAQCKKYLKECDALQTRWEKDEKVEALIRG